jgi:hypothetical protein
MLDKVTVDNSTTSLQFEGYQFENDSVNVQAVISLVRRAERERNNQHLGICFWDCSGKGLDRILESLFCKPSICLDSLSLCQCQDVSITFKLCLKDLRLANMIMDKRLAVSIFKHQNKIRELRMQGIKFEGDTTAIKQLRFWMSHNYYIQCWSITGCDLRAEILTGLHNAVDDRKEKIAHFQDLKAREVCRVNASKVEDLEVASVDWPLEFGNASRVEDLEVALVDWPL